MMRQRNLSTPRRQHGAVLIVALVLLLVLTILGTAGMRDTAMEERMAGNFRDFSAALEAAETALRVGEGALADPAAFKQMPFDGSDGTYSVTSHSIAPLDPSSAVSWRIVPPAVMDKAETLIDSDPEYYLERLPEIDLPASDLTVGFQDQAPRVRYYRVTGKGYGISPHSEVVLQSTYFR